MSYSYMFAVVVLWLACGWLAGGWAVGALHKIAPSIPIDRLIGRVFTLLGAYGLVIILLSLDFRDGWINPWGWADKRAQRDAQTAKKATS